jgi:gas vesicle protein
MAKGRSGTGVIIGLAVGVGLGLVAALLLDPNNGARRRARLAEGARGIADRVASLPDASGAWRERQSERVARTFMDRVERIRSAGL